MKTYYINQKLVSLNDKYCIYDINNEPCLEVVANGVLSLLDRILGGIFSLGNKFHIRNLDGKEFSTIKKRPSFLFEKYDIFCGEKNIGTIKHHITALKSKISIITEKDTYIISGDILGRNFIISENGVSVASVKKTTFNIKDKYEISIFKDDNYELFLSAVIAIDNSIHN